MDYGGMTTGETDYFMIVTVNEVVTGGEEPNIP
jgi:hypothetical protein